jgi:putative membrane-bound dehydrogenase-like protein
MRFTRSALVPAIAALLVSPLSADNIQHGLRVPPGFEVTEFADSKLANDIFSMTLDPRGRVVVSGRGYIRILVDDDNDGRADRAIDFAAGPKDGAQGLLWEGTVLYFTGDGGLRRYRDENGDGKADGPSELIRAMNTGGEHNAHAVKRGPDGWLYVLCGNMSGIDPTYATLPTSPIREPVAGCVLRFTPDLKNSEIVADGYRNAYDMDFNSEGELFTFDSDNERCVSLPWYEFTRFYHVIPGGHYGWQAPQRAQWWRLPPYFCDVVAPAATLGRGSPTGVACYRHVQFPEHYRGGLFLLDWTFGRVYFVELQRSGASYTCRKELFLEAVGDNGFAPTAAVVHPSTGDLYIAIGGRGTRGAVYRIRYPQGTRALDPTVIARLRVQPHSSDWQPERARELLQNATSTDALERLRALVEIRRFRPRFTSAEVLGAVLASWDHADRYVRKTAADLLASLSDDERRALTGRARSPLQQTTWGLASWQADPADVLASSARLLARKESSPEALLASVRLIQLALGGLISPKVKGTVLEGYSARLGMLPPISVSLQSFTQATVALRGLFPTGNADLDRELSRTLAMMEDDDPALLTKVAEHLTASSNPIEDIHYLIVLARLRGRRPANVTNLAASTLLALDRKIALQHLNRDRHWPLRVAEMHAELASNDPGLNAAILAAPEFGRPDHALFARCPGFDRKQAAQIFLARAKNDAEFPWSGELIQLIGELPAEQSVPLLRHLWDKGGLEEEILTVFARDPEPADRDKFLRGLGSPQLAIIGLSLGALEKLPPANDGTHALALVRCLRCLPEGKEADRMRDRLGRYLQRLTAQNFGTNKHAWTEWFAKTHPGLAGRLGGADGVDINSWHKRLAKLDWSSGDADRGRTIFARASCATCHSGAQALGPDLHGVAGRFSRNDLFTAMLQPSLDISPRYRTTLVATADEKIYQGIVIYEAVDSLILQTGPATTVRLVNTQITTRRITETSLMPTGLLDKLSDREIADLYAYLRSLGSSANGHGAGP